MLQPDPAEDLDAPPDAPAVPGAAARARVMALRALAIAAGLLVGAGRDLRQAFRSGSAAVVLLPLTIAAPPLYWLWLSFKVAALTALGRDQGIFQYIAWAVRKGDRLYRDILDINGPLTAQVHLVMQLMGGRDEVVFRWLDLLFSSVAFFLAGAVLVGASERVRAGGPAARPHLLQRVTWGLAAWVAIAVQYVGVGYDSWMISQRESFAAWFLLVALALQIAAQARGAGGASRRRDLWLAGSFALGAMTWFSKPTFVLVTPLQLLALFCDDDLVMPWRRRLGCVLAGIGATVLAQLAFLAIFGDVIGYFRILLEVGGDYRFMWAKPVPDLFRGWQGKQVGVAIATSCGLGVLIAARELPRRVLALALAPLAAIAMIAIQRKGFAYHYHPLTELISLQLVFLCLWLAERFLPGAAAIPVAGAPAAGRLERLVPIFAAMTFGAYSLDLAIASPFFKNTDFIRSYSLPAERQADAYLKRFDNGSYSRLNLEQGAHFLRDKIPPGRVFIYGYDPYLLFLARRLSATPYIYNVPLNPTGPLAGGADHKPDEAQKAEIIAHSTASARDLAERLKAAPPVALAILDGLYWGPDGWADLKKHCPDAFAFLEPRYQEAARFGKVRIFARK